MNRPAVDDQAIVQTTVACDRSANLHATGRLLQSPIYHAGAVVRAANGATAGKIAHTRCKLQLRAKLSPFASLRSLGPAEREALLTAATDVLAEALELERGREGGLSEAKLGGRFKVHGRVGEPCPTPCGDTLRRVSFESYEMAVLPDLPDRRQGAGRPPPLPPAQVTHRRAARDAV